MSASTAFGIPLAARHRGLLLAGCGGMNHPKTALLAGTRFPGYEVVPEGARSGVIIVHGIAEHGGRYRHVAGSLAANHIACFVYDQRGHGTSSGPRAHVEDFACFAKDLEWVGKSVRERYPALPLRMRRNNARI